MLNFTNKAVDAKADHVSSTTAKVKKEHAKLYFFFPYALSCGVVRQREIYIFIKKKLEGNKLCFCHVIQNETCHSVRRPKIRYC